MRGKLLIALIIITSFCASIVLAQETNIYKTAHKDGTVTYSDQPSPGAVEVSLNVNTNTMLSISVPKVTAQAQVKQKTRNYHINIISPQQDATIRNNMGQIRIAAAVEPKLGGFYQLSINEQVVDSASGVFVLDNMNRGRYQYQIKFIGNSGKVIALSDSRSLHLHRASVLIN